jgi:hypothetical protein
MRPTVETRADEINDDVVNLLATEVDEAVHVGEEGTTAPLRLT